MTTKKFPFPPGVMKERNCKLKPSMVLHHAAMHIADELMQKTRTCDRSSACNALMAQIYNVRFTPFSTEHERHAIHQRASALFRSLFSKSTFSGFWFGTEMSRREQEHRIIALLTCAVMAESIGE